MSLVAIPADPDGYAVDQRRLMMVKRADIEKSMILLDRVSFAPSGPGDIRAITYEEDDIGANGCGGHRCATTGGQNELR
jgi:hypothetical protein